MSKTHLPPAWLLWIHPCPLYSLETIKKIFWWIVLKIRKHTLYGVFLKSYLILCITETNRYFVGKIVRGYIFTHTHTHCIYLDNCSHLNQEWCKNLSEFLFSVYIHLKQFSFFDDFIIVKEQGPSNQWQGAWDPPACSSRFVSLRWG